MRQYVTIGESSVPVQGTSAKITRTCSVCGGKVLTEQEWDDLERWIAEDQEFDAGEFSGSHDYYEGLCFCGRDDAMRKDPLF